MTSPKKGEILKYKPTGHLFEVKRFSKDWVILFSQDESCQIMTKKENFHYLFARIPPVESSQEELSPRSRHSFFQVV